MHLLSADLHFIEVPQESPSAFQQSRVDGTPNKCYEDFASTIATENFLEFLLFKCDWQEGCVPILIKTDQIIQAVTNLLPLFFSLIFRAVNNYHISKKKKTQRHNFISLVTGYSF